MVSFVPGTELGRYQVVGRVARGGMATVYKGRDPELGRDVAIKVLPSNDPGDPTFVERFRREAKAIAGLNHPNIVQIYDFGEDKDCTYIVMEYVTGGTVHYLLGRPLPYNRILRLITPLCDALDVAHGKGIIHRDIKPSNILLHPDGKPVLSDFGLVRLLEGNVELTQRGSVIGTPEYMAPEQAMGQPADQRSDLYSLGIIIYQMLAGRTPFSGDSPHETLLAQVREPVPRLTEANPGIGTHLDAVVTKALSKDPDQRYQTPGELVATLTSVFANLKPESTLPTTSSDAGGALPYPTAPIGDGIVDAEEGTVVIGKGGIDWDRLKQFTSLLDTVLDEDLAGLRATSSATLDDWWRRITDGWDWYRTEGRHHLQESLNQRVRGKARLAQLLIIKARRDETYPQPDATERFSARELSMVEELEHYKLLDVLNIEQIVERTHRKDGGVYELVASFYNSQYQQLDSVLEDADIQKDLMTAFLNRYQARFDKIREALKRYVDRYGPQDLLASIKLKVEESIRASEEQRMRVLHDLNRQVEELEQRLQGVPLEETQSAFHTRLENLSARVGSDQMSSQEAIEVYSSFEADEGSLKERLDALGHAWDDQVCALTAWKVELAERERHLVQESEQHKESLREEGRQALAAEIGSLSDQQRDLEDRYNALRREREAVEHDKQELAERLELFKDALEGKPVRVVESREAQAYERNAIGRFEAKMEDLPKAFYLPTENRELAVQSWPRGMPQRSDNSAQIDRHLEKRTDWDSIIAEVPIDLRSRYILEEKRYRLFGDTVPKLIIEMVCINHWQTYAEYGLDATPAALSDLLRVLIEFDAMARSMECLHILGIVSPTGWSQKSRETASLVEQRPLFMGPNLAFCLVDPISGEIFYNDADDRLKGYTELFTPEFDREQVVRCKKHILVRTADSYAHGVPLAGITGDAGFSDIIARKAFDDLQSEGLGTVRHRKDQGLVFEAAV